MKIIRANSRGRSHFDWLDSRHTSSFGEYHDPARMGVSALRVLNDDVVAPGAGFDTHPHRDMEILSYVDAAVYRLLTGAGNSAMLALAAQRTGFVHIVAGALEPGDTALARGDGLAVTGAVQLELLGTEASEALWFDLPGS